MSEKNQKPGKKAVREEAERTDLKPRQAGEEPVRELIVWENGAQTRDGGRIERESTVRAVPLGTGNAGAKPPVIVIVSSGFGAASHSASPVRMARPRMDAGLRMAA